jgi:hypothetical protein
VGNIMNKGATVFLRGVLILVGTLVLGLLLWEPRLEGRNANATVFQVYFQDPFLAYAYTAAIPFFVGLYQAFRVLGFAARGEEFSAAALQGLRTIKRCAQAIIAFVLGGVVFLFIQTSDDRAGGVMIGLFIIFASLVVATAMSVLERATQQALDLKSEHDLTV